MKLHKQGYRILLIAFVFFVLVNLLINNLLVHYPIIWMTSIGISFIIYLLIINFFRNPTRQYTQNDNAILSSADGKVVVIEEVMETEYLNEKRIQISVFMSPLNVHINRSPIKGIIEYVKYHSGKYLVAWHPKSSTQNERNTIVIKNEHFNILIRQIAGAMARRIHCYVSKDDSIKQADEVGFISFGSRVDHFIPMNAKIKVKIGDKVIGGISTLAEI